MTYVVKWCFVLPGCSAAVSLRSEPPGSDAEHGEAQQVLPAAEDGVHTGGAGDVEEGILTARLEAASN